MKDYLQNEFVSEAIKRLGIPLPVPTPLIRDNSAYSPDALHSKIAIINEIVSNTFHTHLSIALADMVALEDANHESADILLLDATNFDDIEDLDDAYAFIHQNIKKLNLNGRIIIFDENNAKKCVIHAALQGFVKSLAKEIGAKGSTANLVSLNTENILSKHADAAIGVLHFLLTDKSSFITGQTFSISGETASGSYQNILAGKVAVVTGAARGIGAETATTLAREGAKVVLIDVESATTELEILASKIGGIALALDITNPNASKLIKNATASLGGIDILVNNAGIIRDKTIAKMTHEQWKMVLKVNLEAVMNVTNELLHDGLNESASIVGLSSINGIGGAPGQTNYAATKSAMIAYMESIAKSQTHRNITANAIAPGFIETPMTAKLPFFIAEGGRRLSSLRQAGMPFDIAEAITFICSPLGKNISGTVLRVCGGNFIGA
jgi:3-oxoacyl-[acyl-carrier protein] reductase